MTESRAGPTSGRFILFTITALLLMDFVAGPTLEEVLAGRRRATEPGAGPAVRAGLLTTIGPQLLDALYALHEAGFEHGDLTPSNVVVIAKPDMRKPDGTFEPGAIERLVLLDLGRNHLSSGR